MVLKTSQKAGSFLLALVMLLSLTSVFCFKSASAATDGEWKYELENGGVTITGFIGTSRTISVPSKVNGQRVKKVTALNNNNTKASVTTVSFANGIEEIGTGVCKGYISLERVALPDTLVTIGSDAFFNCSSLTGITIPNSPFYAIRFLVCRMSILYLYIEKGRLSVKSVLIIGWGMVCVGYAALQFLL